MQTKTQIYKKEGKKEKKRDRELKIYICLNLKERVATPKDRHNRDQKVVGWLYMFSPKQRLSTNKKKNWVGGEDVKQTATQLTISFGIFIHSFTVSFFNI